MSVAGISTSSLTQTGTIQSALQKSNNDFERLTDFLQTGDGSGTTSALKSLQEDVPASGTFPGIQLGDDVSALSSALSSGNSSAAHKAYSALQCDLQTALATTSTNGNATAGTNLNAGSSQSLTPNSVGGVPPAGRSHHHRLIEALSSNLLNLAA